LYYSYSNHQWNCNGLFYFFLWFAFIVAPCVLPFANLLFLSCQLMASGHLRPVTLGGILAAVSLSLVASLLGLPPLYFSKEQMQILVAVSHCILKHATKNDSKKCKCTFFSHLSQTDHCYFQWPALPCYLSFLKQQGRRRQEW
jgi:hypothetical protein